MIVNQYIVLPCRCSKIENKGEDCRTTEKMQRSSTFRQGRYLHEGVLQGEGITKQGIRFPQVTKASRVSEQQKQSNDISKNSVSSEYCSSNR